MIFEVQFPASTELFFGLFMFHFLYILVSSLVNFKIRHFIFHGWGLRLATTKSNSLLFLDQFNEGNNVIVAGCVWRGANIVLLHGINFSMWGGNEFDFPKDQLLIFEFTSNEKEKQSEIRKKNQKSMKQGEKHCDC